MTEHIFSLLDNYKSKIRNPFIGTILSVWLLRNWKIVFAIFTFDNDRTMECKINYISSYFSKVSFWWELVDCFLIAFLTLLITFILLGISRFITDYYFKVVEPYIVTKVDKNAILTVAEKEKLEKRIIYLGEKLDKQDDALEKSEKANEFLKVKNKEIETESEKKLLQISELNLKSDREYERMKEEYNNVYPIIDEYNSLSQKLNSSELNTLKLIDRDFKMGTISSYLNKESHFKKLSDYGLIKHDENKVNYQLTVCGDFFLTSYFLANNNNKTEEAKVKGERK